MITRNVDIAAYLHLSGILPNRIKYLEDLRINEFEYEDSPMLDALLKAFEHGAMVPAMEFAEARATMKGRRGNNAAGNYRKAIRRILHNADKRK